MSVYIIATVILLLIILAGYLFLSHSIEKRRVQRQRLITALKARRNSFRDLATAFPAGFLSADLTALLYRALIDCCEQLLRLEPKDPAHSEQISLYSNMLGAQKENTQQQRVRLENPQQIKEAKQLLQELYKFIMQQSALHIINQVQTEAYVDQIKRLVLQMTVDGHIFNARQAQQVAKVRLAIHYYGLGRKLLLAENASHSFDKQIAQLDAVIAKLEEKANEAGETATTEQSTTTDAAKAIDEKANKEWDQFDKKNDTWKKKNVYD